MTTDVLGTPFEASTLRLPPDDEGEVIATLVKHRGPQGSRKAVLYVHGFNDYFFQRELAERYVAYGYHFYALDLRKYGRSLRPHQSANFCRDVAEYFAEIDLAFERIAEDGCENILLNGHSTGGLTCALYAHDRRPQALRAVFLNSPFLELNAGWLSRKVLAEAIAMISRARPYAKVPLGLSGLYGQSLHRDHHGEWEFSTAWKPIDGFPVYAGWLAAIRRAHRQVQGGIDIGVPVLVMHSARSIYASAWTDELMFGDAVLNVKDFPRIAPRLGAEVTLLSVDGGLHDLFLSRPYVRGRVYDHLFRWLTVYGP